MRLPEREDHREGEENRAYDQAPFQEPQKQGDVEFDQTAHDFEDAHSDLSDIVRLHGHLITGGKVFNPALSDAS
jgi:hypothetical protein